MAEEGVPRSDRQNDTRRRIRDGGRQGVSWGGGFPTGAMYSNFGGKEVLFIALLDAHVEGPLTGVDEVSGQMVRTRRVKVCDEQVSPHGPLRAEVSGAAHPDEACWSSRGNRASDQERGPPAEHAFIERFQRNT